MSRTDDASTRRFQAESSARRRRAYARGFITGRWLVLGTLLALSLIGAVQVANDNESEAAVVPELSRHHRPKGGQVSDAVSSGFALPTEAHPEVMHRAFHRPSPQEVKDVFTPHSWHLPPAPVAVAESVPTAPPIPFVYLGKLLEDGNLTIFLARQDKNFTVREGDVLDDMYRVDAIKGPIVELTYLPLNLKQTLFIGEKN